MKRAELSIPLPMKIITHEGFEKFKKGGIKEIKEDVIRDSFKVIEFTGENIIKELNKLLKLAINIENLYGVSQDIKFAYKRKYWILQARPITI